MSLLDCLLTPDHSTAAARQAALDRAHADPGVPNQDETTSSFWLKQPHTGVAKARSTSLPERTEAVIIGSGITGVAVAHALLEQCGQKYKDLAASDPAIVILEARDASSGATGRNGGHILPVVEDYIGLKAELGQEAAAEIIRFRTAHVGALLSLADRLSLRSTSQGREVQSLSVYLDDTSYREALNNLAEFRRDMPVESDGYAFYDADEARQRFYLSRHACGVISSPAGAIWPYKLTAGILELLLADYPQVLTLETNTPVEDISVVEDGDADHPYRLVTPRGVIRAAKVVHCTNGHVSHLVPGLRGIVVPLRGQMSAQSPGEKFHGGGQNKSWTFHYKQGFDYLVQLPVDGIASDGEMMLGGGINPATEAGIQEFGVSDDSELNAEIDVHLSGALSAVFGRENWGAVSGPSVSHMWTGIMGFSSDGHPWVGKLPSNITGRPVGSTAYNEWVAAGYSGEGMVHAWLCGKALATMILSHEKQLHVEKNDLEDSLWIPERFKVNDARLQKALLPRKAN